MEILQTEHDIILDSWAAGFQENCVDKFVQWAKAKVKDIKQAAMNCQADWRKCGFIRFTYLDNFVRLYHNLWMYAQITQHIHLQA